MTLLTIILVLLAVPALLATGYLALLTLLSRRPAPVACLSQQTRFDVVVPAHDEEAGIVRTVKNLLALEWPSDLFRVVVVADNCSDHTAERARAAGATVLVRHDEERRGKGYALDFAFSRMLEQGWADAAVVVDADTIASPNLLSAFASGLEAGALAMQAKYSVLNGEASWRTRLMAIAFALFNDVRSLGRERLRVSTGLRGNGMCMSAEALRRVPHDAYSVVEDLEYGIRLGEDGIRVAYAHDAWVTSEMVAGEKASRSQRQRWEGGRIALMRMYGLDLLQKALVQRDRVLFDLSIDVLIPPLSWVVAYTGLGTSAAAVLALGAGFHPVMLAPWLLSGSFLCMYVFRGVQVSGMGLRGVSALAWAPVFIVWKLALMAARPFSASREWVRTAREGRVG